MDTLTPIESSILSYGPHKVGATLVINPEVTSLKQDLLTAIDVETDEKDNFVGIALCQGATHVEYYSKLPSAFRFTNIIGHNVKADAHWLTSWGLTINSENLTHDTMIMSYVKNSTKESHALKELCKEYLNLEWPTYKQMVGKGNQKVTLDKQEIVNVANYCGMDCLATFKLYSYLNKILTPGQRNLYTQIEMPTLRILYDMELRGVTVDVPYLNELKIRFDKQHKDSLAKLQEYAEKVGFGKNCKKTCPKKEHVHTFNPASPLQVKEILTINGFETKSTDKHALAQFTGHEFVDTLMTFREANKIKSTYIDAFLEMPSLPNVYPTFNQVTYDKQDDQWKGIRTGRLSCSNPNLQNIPARGEVGDLVRRAFIPTSGNTLVCADYSQIEYRLLAHFTKEPRLIDAYRNGKDVHEETGKALGVDRQLGKTLNFAAIYGAHPKRIAQTAKISEESATKFLDAYWRVLPSVARWIKRVKLDARIHKQVRTMFGRIIPIPGISSGNRYEVFHWERAAVNYIIQGSAADIIKVALINLKKRRIEANLQVHDELIFDYHEDCTPVEDFKGFVKNIMENVVKIDVPLQVSINTGKNWYESKGH